MGKHEAKPRSGKADTIAPIQEGKKEEKCQCGDEMQVDFSQEFLLVDHVLTSFQYGKVVGLDVFYIGPFFLLGHCRREKRERSEDDPVGVCF